MLLSVENVKAELSYAYLHAIAARAHFSCQVTDRHGDNAGVDAMIRITGPLAADSVLTDFVIEVQLKATSAQRRSTRLRPGHFTYSLEKPLYDRLRSINTESQRLLVVLFLPSTDARWLCHSRDSLVSRHCAYWMSLQGAPPSNNETSQTVYLPKNNILTVEALTEIATTRGREDWVQYEG